MKKTIRKEIINKRKSLTKDEVNKKSHNIFLSLLNLNIIKSDMKILVYMDFRNEVSTVEINKYIMDNYTLLLPKVDKETNTLTIYEIDSLDSLELSDYNILEPKSSNTIVDYKDIDLILAPGVAFDNNCYRLGYGGGFYDKLLSQKRDDTKVIALSFDLQFVNEVPTEEHDIQMDYIITESKLINS